MELIVIGILYVLVLLAFRGLGGFDSAGEAVRQWGRAASRLDV
jgi:hypothetical protein